MNICGGSDTSATLGGVFKLHSYMAREYRSYVVCNAVLFCEVWNEYS
jgi:hypothetical protein